MYPYIHAYTHVYIIAFGHIHPTLFTLTSSSVSAPVEHDPHKGRIVIFLYSLLHGRLNISLLISE